MKVGFDNERYLEEQTKAILERVAKFKKLYLEFGGKITWDMHAARVLPGYDPNVKVSLLKRLSIGFDLIFCISAKDCAKGRLRGDFGLTYDMATLRSIEDLQKMGIPITAVMINRFNEEPKAIALENTLIKRGIRVYKSREITNYPNDIENILSSKGYGSNPYIETTKPIVIIAGTGPGSGKMATALQQYYHDTIKGNSSGYAKFETFPIWDLPLKHPVNVAYEAATADIADVNLIDPFNTENETTNYNRDIEAFPILRAIMNKNDGFVYNSPTEMGVNRASTGIIDQEVIQEAAKQEIIRRFFRYNWEYAIGVEKEETVEAVKKTMDEFGISIEDRSVVVPARLAADQALNQPEKGYQGAYCGAAIQLQDKTILTGKNSELLYSTSAAILNAIKYLAGIPDNIHLLTNDVICNMVSLKQDILNKTLESMDVREALTALAVSATANPSAKAAFEKLFKLKGTEMHMTHVPCAEDVITLRKLGINFTTDARFTPGGFFLK